MGAIAKVLVRLSTTGIVAVTLLGCTSTDDSNTQSESQATTIEQPSSTETPTSEIATDTDTSPESTEGESEPAADPVTALVDQLGAGELVVQVDGNIVAVDNQGPEPHRFQWASDVHFDPRAIDPHTEPTTLFGVDLFRTDGMQNVVYTIDGTEVCRSERPPNQTTRDESGTWTMVVSDLGPAGSGDPDAGWVDADGSPLDSGDAGINGLRWFPTFTVDCETGASNPTLPSLATGTESGGLQRVVIGDRSFEIRSDAEGNGPIVNESNADLTDGDYAGYYAFSSDGSQVVYSDHNLAASPHYSNFAVSRDTTTAEVLWRIELDAPFTQLFVDDDRVYFMTTDEPFGSGLDGETPKTIVVVDASTGEILDQVEKPDGITLLHIERQGDPDITEP